MSCVQLHGGALPSKVDECISVGGSTTTQSCLTQQRLHHERNSVFLLNEPADRPAMAPDSNNLVEFLINRQHVSTSEVKPKKQKYTPQVKIDSLYKPILRRFRCHFRSKFDLHHNKKLYQHWSTETYMTNVRKFMTNDLRLPAALLDQENVVKMLTLLFPCSTRKHLPASAVDMVTPVKRFHLAQVFRENNLGLRHKFFEEPLVKYLWSKIFITECSEVCVAHLRRIRSYPDNGEFKFRRIWGDMMKLEHKFNFKMIPDNARNYENTTVFS